MRPELINLTPEQIEFWKPKILAKLRAEGAKNLSNRTLQRVFGPTVAGEYCIQVAMFLRHYGYICTGRID